MGTWLRRSLLVALAVVIGLSVAVSSITILSYSTVSIDTSVNGVEVKYFSYLFTPQQFKIVVENVSGQVYPTTLSLYVWMPNGSIIELGKFLGKNGAIDIKVTKIVSFLREWYGYLASRGNDPRLVKPGIIVLGAIHTPKGIYGVMKGIPLDMAKILRGLSVEIKITEKLTPNNILVPISKVKEFIELAKSKVNASVSTEGIFTENDDTDRGVVSFSSSWPPGEIEDYCGTICDEGGCIYYCFIWKLDKVYASVLNQGAPLVVAYVYDGVGGDYVKRVNDVLLREYFEAEESKGIEVAFGITASVKKGSGEISYSIPGFTVELGGDNHVWLDYYKRFFEGSDFSNRAILAIGMKGDFAFAKYKLQYCYTSIIGWTCIDTDEEANMTLARPVIENNEILPWSDVDTSPDDGAGIAEKAFKYIKENWEWSVSHKEYGGIYIDAFTVSDEINTHPLFSTSMAILPIILSEVPEAYPFVAIVSATVGLTEKESTKMLVACDISIQKEYASNTYVWANYFYSPTQFDYKGNKYYVGSLYIDALIGSS